MLEPALRVPVEVQLAARVRASLPERCDAVVLDVATDPRDIAAETAAMRFDPVLVRLPCARRIASDLIVEANDPDRLERTVVAVDDCPLVEDGAHSSE